MVAGYVSPTICELAQKWHTVTLVKLKNLSAMLTNIVFMNSRSPGYYNTGILHNIIEKRSYYS